jgi:hypothetical protein
MPPLQGSIGLITPFANGTVDAKAFRKLVSGRSIRHARTQPCGTTGNRRRSP